MSIYTMISHSEPSKDRKYKEDNQDVIYTDITKNIAIIADGMSCCGRNGKESSQMAVDFTKQKLNQLFNNLKNNADYENYIEDEITHAITDVNEILLLISQHIEKYNNIGTTLDCCLIHKDIAYCGHVGDSRIYYLNKDEGLIQLTNDHYLLPPEHEKINPQDFNIVSHSFRLKEYIGKKNPQIQIIKKELNSGDILFLATDGLYKLITEKELKNALETPHFEKRIQSRLKDYSQDPDQIIKDYSQYYNITEKDVRDQLIKSDDSSYIIIKRR